MTIAPMTEQYDNAFYEGIATGSARSADVVVPLLVSLYHPASVVDVGCGTGAWLAEFERLGVVDLLGIDGGRDVGSHRSYSTGDLVIGDLTQPLPSLRRFDLAMCLEVAEHVPHGSARTLVDELCKLSDRVVFSAAIPGQGGVGHVNEQWPSYWAALFATNNFIPHDVVRPQIWADERVEVWYRQNILVFDRTEPSPTVPTTFAESGHLDVVHPILFRNASAPHIPSSLRDLLRALRPALRRSARFHMQRIRDSARRSSRV